jgi:hypothetical protein
MPTKFEEITLAFEFVSSGLPGAHEAFLCRRTGKIYWHAEFSDVEGFNDELPDDVEDKETYVSIPHKTVLGLGKRLVLGFASEVLPGDFDDVERMFSRRGGYAKFKTLLTRRGALDRWHAFEGDATDQALREWCRDNLIEVSD